MTHPHSTEQRPKCAPCVLALVGGLLLLIVLYGYVGRIVTKVFSGAGMEYCCSIEGVAFDYIGAFILLCGIVAVLVAALVFSVRDWLLRRDFERKYEAKVSASRRDVSQVDGPDFGPSMHGYQHHDDD